MSQTFAIWFLIVAAFIGANLPFVNQRLMLVLPLRGGRKSLGWRLAELIAWFFIVGGIGMAFEQRAGQIAPQGWEFYAITGSLFLTFAFPGFVYRYMLLRGR